MDINSFSGMEALPPRRNLLPSYEGIRKPDLSKLYHSLRRSYVKIGDRSDDTVPIDHMNS